MNRSDILNAVNLMNEEGNNVEGYRDMMEKLNKSSEERIKYEYGHDVLAKAITHYIFRNGPVEDMHSDYSKNITDNDMKVLNKFMVNRVAGILEAIKNNNWLILETLLGFYGSFGGDWDKAEPDIEYANEGMKKLAGMVFGR